MHHARIEFSNEALLRAGHLAPSSSRACYFLCNANDVVGYKDGHEYPIKRAHADCGANPIGGRARGLPARFKHSEGLIAGATKKPDDHTRFPGYVYL